MPRQGGSNIDALHSTHCGLPEISDQSVSRQNYPRETLRVDSLFSESPSSEDGVQKEETLQLSMMKIRALTKLDGKSPSLCIQRKLKSDDERWQSGTLS